VEEVVLVSKSKGREAGKTQFRLSFPPRESASQFGALSFPPAQKIYDGWMKIGERWMLMLYRLKVWVE
jgi:hypothetical protein